jgi:hypothetical protein
MYLGRKRMFSLGWFELIQLHVLITTEVYVCVMPTISRLPNSCITSSTRLVLLPWLACPFLTVFSPSSFSTVRTFITISVTTVNFRTTLPHRGASQ